MIREGNDERSLDRIDDVSFQNNIERDVVFGQWVLAFARKLTISMCSIQGFIH